MSGSCFGLVLVIAKAKKGDDPQRAERALSALKNCIERTARASDTVAQGTDSLMLVLGEAALDQTEAAARRVKKALRRMRKGVAGKDARRNERSAQAFRQIQLGVSVYPTHGTTRAALLARATAAAEML
jgi:GGDEF domain-containing protein